MWQWERRWRSALYCSQSFLTEGSTRSSQSTFSSQSCWNKIFTLMLLCSFKTDTIWSCVRLLILAQATRTTGASLSCKSRKSGTRIRGAGSNWCDELTRSRGLLRRLCIALGLLLVRDGSLQSLGAKVDEVKKVLIVWHTCAGLIVFLPFKEGQLQFKNGSYEWARRFIAHRLECPEVLLHECHHGDGITPYHCFLGGCAPLGQLWHGPMFFSFLVGSIQSGHVFQQLQKYKIIVTSTRDYSSYRWKYKPNSKI